MSPEHSGGQQLEGLPARILELGEELRREGVAVGTSELLDAFEVLAEISWTEQNDFREALAATLAKSREDRRVFELVVDRFFFRAAALAAARDGAPAGGPRPPAPGGPARRPGRGASRRRPAAPAPGAPGPAGARAPPSRPRRRAPDDARLAADRRCPGGAQVPAQATPPAGD